MCKLRFTERIAISYPAKDVSLFCFECYRDESETIFCSLLSYLKEMFNFNAVAVKGKSF